MTIQQTPQASSLNELDHIRCNNCYTIFIDEDELELLLDGDEWFKACPVCKTDSYLMSPFMEVA